MKAVIIGGAPIYNYNFYNECFKSADVVICCDAGVDHAKALNITPDYIMGDFDSATHSCLEYFKNIGVPIKTFPSKKDETDMELGIDFAIDNLKADEVVILGGIGVRLDHTIANCHLLYRCLKKRIKACLVNENNYIFIFEKHCYVYGEKGDLMSLLPFSEKLEGITLKGFEYPLDNANMEIDSPRGVSNVMLSSIGEIFIKDGIGIVIKSKD